jgi:hypothetical protein
MALRMLIILLARRGLVIIDDAENVYSLERTDAGDVAVEAEDVAALSTEMAISAGDSTYVG